MVFLNNSCMKIREIYLNKLRPKILVKLMYFYPPISPHHIINPS